MLTIRIQGKCNAKDKIGGWSAIVGNRTICGGAVETTHQRMELTALVEAIKSFKPQKEKLCVQLVTKNSYIPNGMKNFRAYQKNNFCSAGNTPIRNLDLWDALIREANKRNIFIVVAK